MMVCLASVCEKPAEIGKLVLSRSSLSLDVNPEDTDTDDVE